MKKNKSKSEPPPTLSFGVPPLKCSKWCGAGCTRAQYDRAVLSARGLVAMLGAGWVPRVHENLGWHASAVYNRALKVTRNGDQFTAYLCDKWVASASSPRMAVNAVQMAAADHISNLQSTLRSVAQA